MQSPLINVMSAAAIKAGKGLLRDFGEVNHLQVSKKGPANFVTESDVRTEKLLRKELTAVRPDFGFLMEEGGEVAGKDTNRRWIIDPLDGTTNFIHAVPYFCISIALEERVAGGRMEITAGVIFDPIHNELFSVEKGKGAMVNNRKLAVSGRMKLEESLLSTSAKSPDATYSSVTQAGATVRGLGATALELAYVAAGRLDGCWYNTIQPWDIAAGLLMIKEAGGMACELSGGAASAYSKTLLAANQPLFPAIHKLIAKAA